MAFQKQDRPQIFISYSHKDDKWLTRLRVHLKPLEREYGVDVWDDTKVKAGSIWREEIEKAVRSARVAILLISADFLASEFIATNELPHLLRAAETKGMVILPIIISPSFFADTTLTRFQTVNDPSKPLAMLSRASQEAVFVKVAQAVKHTLNSLSGAIDKEQQPESSPREQSVNKIHRIDTAVHSEEHSSPLRTSLEALTKRTRYIMLALITIITTLITGYCLFVYKPSVHNEYVGRVRDAQTNRPIYKAKVSIEEDGKVPQIQETDSEGIFKVNLLESTKDVRVVVEAEGYEIFDRSVPLTRTGIEPIRLTPSSALPGPTPAVRPRPPSGNNKSTSTGSGRSAGRRPAQNASSNSRDRERQALEALNTRSPAPRP